MNRTVCPEKRPAVFLDRDGTVTESAGYVTTPEQIRLIPDAADCISQFRRAGYCCVLVTNQSAIERGMLSVQELDTIHNELQTQLAAHGTQLDAIYISPRKPNTGDESVIEHFDRKPGPGMLLRAAVDLNLDLSRSWMIGDRLSDVLAGIHAGCRSIRVRTGYTYRIPDAFVANGFITLASLTDVADHILRSPTISEQ
ncbi:MAG: HAD family hydrolase [Planctomycetaceae bacterium]